MSTLRHTEWGPRLHSGRSGAFISLLLLLPALAASSEANRAADKVVVLTPVANSVYRVGDTMVIAWTQSEEDDGMTIRFSSDTGISYTVLTSFNSASPNYGAREWKWGVTDSVFDAGGVGITAISEACRIKVHGYFKELSLYGYSGLFSIRPATDTRNSWRRSKPPADFSLRKSQGRESSYLGRGAPLFDLHGRALESSFECSMPCGTILLQTGTAGYSKLLAASR